jgi:hypothetical protein
MPTPSELEVIVTALSSALGDGWVLLLAAYLFKKITCLPVDTDTGVKH